MGKDNLEKVTDDLLSVLPLILRSIHRKMIKTTFTASGAEITPLHFRIMHLLSKTGKLEMAKIGKQLQIARPQMTHLIDKLVELNIVERQAGTSDRRTISISLTESGKKNLEKHKKLMRKNTLKALSAFSDEDVAALSAALASLKELFTKLE
jgi:DNA-binding MarR family transcriptional regulator